MAIRRPHGRSERPKARVAHRRMPQAAHSQRRRILLVLLLLLPGLIALLIVPLRWLNPPVTAFMLQQTEADERSYEWTSFSDINESAALAVIASEDQRFLEHNGIDVDAIQKALEDADGGNGARGASTITQQLIKNLYLWSGRSLLLEVCLPKQRILELYLNVVQFGPGVYGVGAASRIYFAKPASRLNTDEAALLAAALPNPVKLRVAAPSAYPRGRQRWIMGQMQRLRAQGLLRRI